MRTYDILGFTRHILLLNWITSNARPAVRSLHDDLENKIFAENYLLKFGYFSDSSSGQTSSLQTIDNAVAKFQAFAGLEETGEIDDKTLEFMSKKRCGVKDFGSDAGEVNDHTEIVIHKRHKRFALQGSRWRKKSLTYRITSYPSKKGLSKKDVDRTIKKAFEVWSRSTNLNFERKLVGDVHIEISFEVKDHGDDDAFDGLGGTLAHAFFPVYGGDVHFDDEENWTVDTFRGTSLLMSATHELGHSLGLSHSNVKDSMMAPFYRGYQPNIKLHADDIKGIQELYGKKVTVINKKENTSKTKEPTVNPVTFFPIKTIPSTTPSSITSPSTTPSTPIITSTEVSIKGKTSIPDQERKDSRGGICENTRVDTIVTDKHSDTYVFQGSKYWKLTDTSVEPGYPKPIAEGWSGLADDIDAAFTWTNGKTYFIKDSLYWRFSEVGDLDEGYPKNFSKAFKGIPTNADAAMVWPVNKKIYFFKGDQYWKFDPEKSPSVESSYPRPITNWEGIPSNLDAAMLYSNGKTYFFKHEKYFRFDNQRGTVDESADPEYPRDIGLWWLGCKGETAPLRLD